MPDSVAIEFGAETKLQGKNQLAFLMCRSDDELAQLILYELK